MCFIVVCTLIDNDYASLLFSQAFFRIVSAWKVWRVKVVICIMQRVHFQVWVGVSSCQQIFTEISFVIFDIVVKKQIECRLAWHWWNSTDLGHVFWAIRMQKLLLVYYYSAKSRCKPNLKSTSKYDFFPRFGGKKWRRSDLAHATYPGPSCSNDG